MKPIVVQKVAWRRSRNQKVYHVEMDIDTFHYLMELNSDLENRLLGVDQVREEYRRLGVPADFVWASRDGESPFVMGDLLSISLATSSVTREISARH